MAFACVYLLVQQDEHSSAKNAGTERAETGFRLIWNNYQSTTCGLPNLTEFKKTYTSILKDKKSLTKNVCLAVLMYSFIYSKSYILFPSIGYDISILQLVSLSLILWIISVVPTPGGFGFKEIVMIGMYTMVRVPISIAAIVSVLTELFICFL